MTHPNRGIAALLAAQGRNGDDELIHVNKRELAALERLGQRHGIQTTVNPRTGLKEAFNWASTAGAVLGGIGGTFAAPFTAGVINPYTGAALGSAAGTKLSGGSNEEALMNGVISGVTAWGMGGVSDALAEAGKEAGKTAVTEGVKTGVQEGAQGVVQEGVASALPQATGTFPGSDQAFGNAFTGQVGGPNAFVANVPAPTVTPTAAAPQLPTGVEAFAKPDAGAMATIDPGYYGAENVGSQGVNTYTSQGTKEMVAAGAPPGVTSSVAPGSNTLTQSGTNADYWSNVGKGLGSLDTPGKAGEFAVANKGNLLAGGLGAYGMATDVAAQPETTGGSTVDTSMPGVEVYYTPYGERRTRVIDRPRYDNVNMAEGGLTFSDYDAADVGSDGGYAPGGLACYAGGGGIGFIESIQPGGKWGEITTDAFEAVNKNNPEWLQSMQPGGFLGATQPGYLGAQKRKEEEEKRKKEEAEGLAKAKAAAAFDTKWDQRYNAPMGMAGGGIANLGYYSDGGQLLRGPGDGVSDNIPATIEGKRPARLADGEFVIPARAVSELGNGSTEAGSKQLYKMLDRIAQKRKKGKGLAYNANPQKLMPV